MTIFGHADLVASACAGLWLLWFSFGWSMTVYGREALAHAVPGAVLVALPILAWTGVLA